jgi:hypothetical protein
MDIIYQTTLNNTPSIKSKYSDLIHQLVPLSIDEIVNLETTYNSGNQFPPSLRELLFLAGQYCYVLDYGMNDTQEEMQNDVQDWFIDYSFSITRPFFVIDVHNGSDAFLFVYLDEGINDPMVYLCILDINYNTNYPRLRATESTLSSLINKKIGYLQSGINPF